MAEPPRNRRERRAANKKPPPASTSASDIPLTMPDYDARPTGKTLLDLAEDRRRELAGETPIESYTTPEGITVIHKDGDFEFMATTPLDPFATAVLYTFSLAALHLTLDVLCLTQYQQDVVWREIFGRVMKMAPALLGLVWMSHVPGVKRWEKSRQVVFLAAAVAAGCYLIYAANERGYYFVMKRAPGLGTLWVWAVVEMEVMWAVGHIALVGGFMWYRGFGAF